MFNNAYWGARGNKQGTPEVIFPAEKILTRSTPSSSLIASKIDFFFKMAFVALSKNSRIFQTSNSKGRFEPVGVGY